MENYLLSCRKRCRHPRSVQKEIPGDAKESLGCCPTETEGLQATHGGLDDGRQEEEEAGIGWLEGWKYERFP